MLQRADGQLENLETLIHDLEFAMIETQVSNFNYSFYYSDSFILFFAIDAFAFSPILIIFFMFTYFVHPILIICSA